MITPRPEPSNVRPIRRSENGAAVSAPDEVVQICAWCLPDAIRLLSPFRPATGEFYTIGFDEARRVTAYRLTPQEWRQLKISHGICAEHKKVLSAKPTAGGALEARDNAEAHSAARSSEGGSERSSEGKLEARSAAAGAAGSSDPAHDARPAEDTFPSD